MEVELIIDLIKNESWLVVIISSFVAIGIATITCLSHNYQANKALKTQIQLSLFNKRHDLYISLQDCAFQIRCNDVNKKVSNKDIDIIQKAYNTFIKLKFLIEEKDLKTVSGISKAVTSLSLLKNNVNTYKDEIEHLKWCIDHQVEDVEKLKEDIIKSKGELKIAVDKWYKEFEKILDNLSTVDKIFEKYLKVPYANTECRYMYYPTM